MDKKLEKFLVEHKIKYALHKHKKVFTAHDEAQTQHIKTKEVAKVILVKTEYSKDFRSKIFAISELNNKYALVVVPAQKYVDFGKVKKALSAQGGSAPGRKVKKVSMAKESDITKILKTKIGLIHPFGNLYELPVLLDNALAKQKKLMASAGSYTESVELKSSDFVKFEQPTKGSFSK